MMATSASCCCCCCGSFLRLMAQHLIDCYMLDVAVMLWLDYCLSFRSVQWICCRPFPYSNCCQELYSDEICKQRRGMRTEYKWRAIIVINQQRLLQCRSLITFRKLFLLVLSLFQIIFAWQLREIFISEWIKHCSASFSCKIAALRVKDRLSCGEHQDTRECRQFTPVCFLFRDYKSRRTNFVGPRHYCVRLKLKWAINFKWIDETKRVSGKNYYYRNFLSRDVFPRVKVMPCKSSDAVNEFP